LIIFTLSYMTSADCSKTSPSIPVHFLMLSSNTFLVFNDLKLSLVLLREVQHSNAYKLLHTGWVI